MFNRLSHAASPVTALLIPILLFCPEVRFLTRVQLIEFSFVSIRLAYHYSVTINFSQSLVLDVPFRWALCIRANSLSLITDRFSLFIFLEIIDIFGFISTTITSSLVFSVFSLIFPDILFVDCLKFLFSLFI